jgi:hypothetical protein
MNRRYSPFSLVTAALLLISTVAHGSEAQWNTSGAFDDGGTFSGFFNLDAVNFTSSDWSLSTMGGTTAALPAFTYTPANSSFSSGGTISGHPILQFSTGARFLDIAYNPDLTNAGGASTIFVSPGNSAEFTFAPASGSRNIIEGIAVGVPVPEPASLALVGLGVIGMLGHVWRQRRRRGLS